MLINRSAVKHYAQERGKRFSKAGLDAVNRAVSQVLDDAIGRTRGFATIKEFEVLYGTSPGS